MPDDNNKSFGPPSKEWIKWAVKVEEEAGGFPSTGGLVARTRRIEAFKKTLVRDETVFGNWAFPGTKESVFNIGTLYETTSCTVEEILRHHPGLTAQDVYNAGHLKKDTSWWD